MLALPSTSSSSFNKFTYDVFLNFRGADTRHGFTGNLYKALCDKGFRTFFDDEELRKGEEITPSLVKAIQESRIAITVFSKKYASSSFCLDELVMIMECFKEQGRSVLPVFYDVDPCDVRHQRGTHGEVLAHGRFKDDKEKVRRWREALHQAANLSGDDFKLGNEYEYVFIEKITKEVSKIINRISLKVANYPIGLESRVQEVCSLLKDGPNDGVHMVGIFGIGGIGKSTLARAVYNLIANRFDSLCFLSDVREDSIKHGLVYLQEKLLSKIVGENNIKLGSLHEGSWIIKQRLHGKKVLLVVDNVDNRDQLDAIAGGSDWFGPGSRVIITTRGRDLLINHGIEKRYQVKGFNKKQSHELFTWNAFKYDKVDPSFTEVINQAITYASGLPLALEVIGSNLFRKEIKVWKSALDQYKRNPDKKIHNILKTSFDALEENHQKIFLDIACCLKEFTLEEVEEILHAHYGVSVDYGINMLVEKSLIKIDRFGYVTIHDLIQDMGRDIARQSLKTLGEQSRLGLPQEILEVLQNDLGTDKIEMINLEFPNEIGEVVEWNRNAFRKMQNLKTLIISGCPLAKDVEHLPNSLRILRWEKYPSPSLPIDFHPKELAILKLPEGCFESLQWASAPKKFVNMKVLNFDRSLLMKQIHDLSSLPNLEELSFGLCENLIEIHESIGFLQKLRILNARGCRKLKSFPPLKLSSLEKLNLSECLSLEKFPEILGRMDNVSRLVLWFMDSIKEFPYSIRNLTRLRKMVLGYCGSFKFPSGILALQELDDLTIAECKGLLLSNEDEGDDEQVSSMSKTRLHFHNCNMPPEFLQIVIPRFPNAKELFLQCANLTILPACIEKCHFLRELKLFQCKNLEEMIGIPPNIERLFVIRCTSLSSATREKLLSKKWHEEGGDKMIILPGTEIPEWFELKRREPTIVFWFRNKFPAISLCCKPEQGLSYDPALSINDKKVYPLGEERCYVEENHICIIDKIEGTFKDYVDGMLSENEWNRVVFYPDLEFHSWQRNRVRLQIGLHIIKERSSMDDIKFIDPLLQKEEHRSVNTGDPQSDKEFMQQQQQQANLASSEPHDEGQGKGSLSLHPPPTMNDNVNWGPSSKLVRSYTTITVQGSDNYLWTQDEEFLSLRPCWQEPLDCDNLESNLMQSPSTSHNIMVQDRAVLNPVESSQGPSYVQTQNIQVPCPTSSVAIVCGEEPHLETCCTVLPTTTEESLRNQVEQSQEHVEMESSLDAGGTHVLSHSHGHSSTTATSEDSEDALKLVQDFTTNVPFTYPNPLKNTEDNGLCVVQQLLLLKSNIPTTCEPVEYTEEEEDWLSLPPSLDYVYCSSNSVSDSEPQSLVGSHVEQPLDDVYNNSDSVQSASAIHGNNGLPKKCIVLFLCLLLIVVSPFGSAMWHWCFHHNDILTGTSLQEHQRLTSINQHNLEGCESVNKAKGKGMVALTCNSTAAEDDGKKPITEKLSTTKAVSGSYESSFHSENVDQLVNSLMEIQAPSPQPLDPLAELERVLLGSYDLPPESTSPAIASSSDIQASEVVIILQNLEPFLDNPLERLIADGEIKHQILDCLSKLGLLEDHIPIPLQSIVAQVRDFYEDLIHNFPSIQQTLVDYSCLEETRSKFLENLNQAKAKRAHIDAEVWRGKVQVEELDTEIADLEIKLKAAMEKRNKLQLVIKNGEAEKSKILKDASAWLMESKQVVKKIRSAERAYRDAQNSKARLEGRLATLKGAFAANNNKR